jgi:hypothetical protein
MRNPARRFVWFATASLVVLALLAAGVAHAAESKEILQAVKSGVPNTGDNRVVLVEITAGDW